MGHIPVAKRFLKVRSYSLEKLGETIVNFWPFGVSAWYPMKFHFGAGDILMWIFYLISLLSFFLGSPYLFFTSFIFSGFTLCKNLIVFHCTHARSRCCLQLKRREVSGQWVSKLYPKDINMSKGTNCIFPQFSKKWSKSYYIYIIIYIIPVILFQSSIVRIRTDNSLKFWPSFWKDHPDQYSDRAVALASQASTQTARLDLDTEASTCRQPGLPVASCMVKPSQGSVIMLRNNLRTDPETLSRHGLTNTVLCQHQARDCLRLTSHFDMFSHS